MEEKLKRFKQGSTWAALGVALEAAAKTNVEFEMFFHGLAGICVVLGFLFP